MFRAAAWTFPLRRSSTWRPWQESGPSVDDPRSCCETNVLGTLNLLELCREFGVHRFILASTSSVYGSQGDGPVSEDALSNCPLSPYAASKSAAEALLHSYHHLHGMDAVVLRYFTVYGPAGRPDMSVFRLSGPSLRASR